MDRGSGIGQSRVNGLFCEREEFEAGLESSKTERTKGRIAFIEQMRSRCQGGSLILVGTKEPIDDCSV
jgi:hypothetical protein